MRRARVAVAALFSLAVAACDDGTGPNLNNVPGYTISSVRIFPNEATIFVPDTIRESDQIRFDAIAVGKGGAVLTGLVFAWSTSDESIAVVDANGVVTPVRTGTVKVKASAYKVGEATLVILPATETVEVSPALDSIFVDEPILATRDFKKLTAKATDAFGIALTGVSFAWQSAAANVAGVNSAGVVTATGLGTANVTVSANGASATASMRVVPIVASASLTSPPSQVLALDTVQMVAVARNYSNAVIPRTFNWTSSNPSVATVDSLGRVRFLTTGTATITGRTAFRTASTQITSLERALISIDGGQDFTCGFTNLGRGYCWGLDDVGQTGVEPDSTCFGETRLPCILPPKRMNESQLSFTSISAGGDFGCGVTSDRLVYCWGNDDVGQVGNGGAGGGPKPSAATVRQERFTTVSAGLQHACALNLSGVAYCWGSDSDGQLGDYQTINSTTPIPVSDETIQFTSISAGDFHTCGIASTGRAWCWGRGAEGQLGNSLNSESQVPIEVAGGHSYIAIAAGGRHTCAVEVGGAMYCWGDNTDGQLGTGFQSTGSNTPVVMNGASNFSAVASGENHSCGISGGQVWCWGGSEFGEVGDGSPLLHAVPSPLPVVGSLQAAKLSAGANHTCAISTGGQAFCWGSNRWGALGNELQAAVRASPDLVARPR